MKVRWILLGVAGAALSLPASAAARAWRAVGTVSDVVGTTSLLPLPAASGDEFELRFSYDDAAIDLIPSPDNGGYEILSMRVTIAGSSLDWVGPGSGRAVSGSRPTRAVKICGVSRRVLEMEVATTKRGSTSTSRRTRSSRTR